MEVTTTPEPCVRLHDVDDYDVVLFGALAIEHCRVWKPESRDLERIRVVLRAGYERAVQDDSTTSCEFLGDDALLVVEAIRSFAGNQLRRLNLLPLECRILDEALDFLDRANA
jgi:hypothetical protein